MIGEISQNLGRAMVAWFCTLDEYAVFENGAFELPLIGVITGSMTSVLLVHYRLMLAKQEYHEIIALLHRAMMKSAVALMPAMFFLLCVAPEFMVCLFGAKYRESAPVFQVYLLMLPVRTMAFGAIALAAGKTKALTIVSLVGLAINFVLNFMAISMFGYIGSAIATVLIVYAVGAYGRALIAKSILQCSMSQFVPWANFGMLSACAAAATPLVLGARLLIPEEYHWIRLIVSTAVYAGVTIPLFIKKGYINPQAIRRFVS
jgi:O-antigen/teichoic acid export membrane protein